MSFKPGGGTGAGIDPFIRNKQVVFMGDSTFFHSGSAAISNSLKNGQDITYVILDNKTTAMTGHQPTPGIGVDILRRPTVAQDIEQIVRGLGSDADLGVTRIDPSERGRYKKLIESTPWSAAKSVPVTSATVASRSCSPINESELDPGLTTAGQRTA